MTCQLTNLHALYINCWHLNTTCSEYTEEKEQSLPGTLSSSKYSSRDESLNLLPCTNKKPPQVSWYDRPWWAFVAAVPYHCVWPARDDLACAVDAPSSAATAAVNQRGNTGVSICIDSHLVGCSSVIIPFYCWGNWVTDKWCNSAVTIISLFIILSSSQGEVTSRIC